MNENNFNCQVGEPGQQERNQRPRKLEIQNEWIPMQMVDEGNVLLPSLNNYNTPDENLIFKNGAENFLEKNPMPGKAHTIQKPTRRRKENDKSDVSSHFPNHPIDSCSAEPPDKLQKAPHNINSALKINQDEEAMEEMDFLTNVFLGGLLGFGQLVLVGLLLDILWNIVWTVQHVTFLILMALLPTLVGIGILGAVFTVTFSALTKLAIEH